MTSYEGSEYVGPFDASNIRPDLVPKKARPEVNYMFSIGTESGLFKSLNVDDSLPTQSVNMIKAFAAHLQVNLAEIKDGKSSFKSKEVVYIVRHGPLLLLSLSYQTCLLCRLNNKKSDLLLSFETA